MIVYEKQTLLLKRVMLCLKENGVGYNCKLVWMKIFSSLCNFLNRRYFVIEDKKLQEKLAKEALEYSHKFTWDKSGEEFEKTIKVVYNE